MGTSCSCTFKFSFLKNVQPSWTPLYFRAAPQVTLTTRFLKRPKSALQKSELAVLLSPLLTPRQIRNSIISWLVCSRQPPTITPCTSPCLFSSYRSGGSPSLFGSLISCVRKWSSPHSRNFLDYIPSTELYFQQALRKLKSPTRTRARDYEASHNCLMNISSAFSSWLGSL